MTTQPFALDRPIFEDPPDGLGEQEYYFGTLVVGMGGMEGIEVARAFAEAGDRLLEAALAKRESWEAAYPVLFCYRHALEVFLKALVPEAKKQHGLGSLWDALHPYLSRRYRSDHVSWLGDRIMEFHQVDPRSTAFFEDSEKNLAPAAALGMTTVLVGPHAAASAAPFVHHRTDKLAPFLNEARVKETVR